MLASTGLDPEQAGLRPPPGYDVPKYKIIQLVAVKTESVGARDPKNVG